MTIDAVELAPRRSGLDEMPMGPGGRGVWDDTPDEPAQCGEMTFHVARILAQHGLVVLEEKDVGKAFGFTVGWAPEGFGDPDVNMIVIAWRDIDPSRIYPTGRLRRLREDRQEAAKAACEYVVAVLARRDGFSPQIYADNPFMVFAEDPS